ncbi:MAG: helix-turn-helix domain-containing protein [Acidimicrobiia bacterium]
MDTLTQRNNKEDGREGKEGSAAPLMDVPALAKRLSVPERHVRRLVAENRVPYLKWGHLIRFDPRQIETWLQGAQVPVAPARPLRGGRPGRPGAAAERPLRAVVDTGSGAGGTAAEEAAAGVAQVVDEHIGSSGPPVQQTG